MSGRVADILPACVMARQVPLSLRKDSILHCSLGGKNEELRSQLQDTVKALVGAVEIPLSSMFTVFRER